MALTETQVLTAIVFALFPGILALLLGSALYNS